MKIYSGTGRDDMPKEATEVVAILDKAAADVAAHLNARAVADGITGTSTYVSVAIQATRVNDVDGTPYYPPGGGHILPPSLHLGVTNEKTGGVLRSSVVINSMAMMVSSLSINAMNVIKMLADRAHEGTPTNEEGVARRKATANQYLVLYNAILLNHGMHLARAMGIDDAILPGISPQYMGINDPQEDDENDGFDDE